MSTALTPSRDGTLERACATVDFFFREGWLEDLFSQVRLLERQLFATNGNLCSPAVPCLCRILVMSCHRLDSPRRQKTKLLDSDSVASLARHARCGSTTSFGAKSLVENKCWPVLPNSRRWSLYKKKPLGCKTKLRTAVEVLERNGDRRWTGLCD